MREKQHRARVLLCVIILSHRKSKGVWIVVERGQVI